MPRRLSTVRACRSTVLLLLVALALGGCTLAGSDGPDGTPTATQTPVVLPSITQGAVPFIETPECAPIGGSTAPTQAANASATPTPMSQTDRDSLVRRQRDAAARTERETRNFLDDQSWATEPDTNALALLELIGRAEECRDSMADYRRGGTYEAPVEILRAASDQSWYTDGLATTELVMLGDFFDAYLELSKIHLGSPSVVNEPGMLVPLAIERGAAGSVELPRSGRRSLMVLAADEPEGRDAYRQASEALPAIERFAGVLDPAGVVYLVLDVESLCGQTPANVPPGSLQLIFIGEKCLAPMAIYHELTHAFLGADYPGWYTEGMADLLASYLTGSIDRTYAQYIERVQQDGSGRVALNQRFSGLVDPSQYAAGFIFLKEAYDIVGLENMAVLARGLRPRATGTQILAELRRLTPLDKRQAIEDVIALRVGP